MLRSIYLEPVTYIGSNQYLGSTTHKIYRPIRPKITPNLNDQLNLYYTINYIDHWALYTVKFDTTQ